MKSYPFPFPEAIEEEVLAEIARQNPPWCDLDEWDEGEESEGEPTIFAYFCCWHGRTEQLLTNIKRMIVEIEPVSYESLDEEDRWQALDGAIKAVELRLSQFQGLLGWARKSWQYDPQIRAFFEKLSNEEEGPVQDKEGVNASHRKNSNPEKSGSESPELSSQITNETTGISEEYPFPLPVKISHKVTPKYLRLLERYAGGWTPKYFLPLSLACFETWAIRVSEQKDTLYEVCQEVDSPIVWGVKHSLERLLDDFNELLPHFRHTLSYDPWFDSKE